MADGTTDTLERQETDVEDNKNTEKPVEYTPEVLEWMKHNEKNNPLPEPSSSSDNNVS